MRTSAARLLLPAVGVLVLIGLVAIAATGSTPTGSNETRRPGDAFLDTLLSLWLVALIPAAALLVYGLMQRKEIAEEMASGRHRRRGVLGFLLFFGLVTAAFYLGYTRRHLSIYDTGSEDAPVIGAQPKAVPVRTGQDHVYEPHFAWVPVLVVLGLAGAGLVAWYLSVRRRKAAASARETLTETLADVIDDTLDDLRAETDPRRAVIACYARLERALAAVGLPRRLSETQEEHIARILGDLDIGTGSIRRLNELFATAQFSRHDVDSKMKDEAIDALVEVRDELRASEERRHVLERALAAGAVRS